MRDRSDLGPWAADDFNATVRSAIAGIGADAGLPPTVRFLGSVAKLVRRRIANDTERVDPLLPAIFLLQPSPQDIEGGTRHAPILDDGLCPVAGRLWFVSEVAHSGRFVELGSATDFDEVFHFVAETLKLGKVPALLFDPRTNGQQIRFYPFGFARDDECHICELTGTDVSSQTIFKMVDRVWRDSLQTPTKAAPFPIWKNASKRFPGRTAEKTIQGLLMVGFGSKLLACTMRSEYDVDSGRLDILIAEADVLEPSKETSHAIVELKVLRSFTENGGAVGGTTSATAIRDGVIQASAYAIDKHVRVAALCCFDMRVQHTRDASFTQQVRSDADQADVALGLWFLFSSAKQMREVRKALGSGFQEHY